MAIATLRFNLEESSERNAHMRALKADAAYGVIYDMLQYFREKRKYSQEPKEKLEVIEEVADKLNEILSNSGVNIYDEYE